MADVITVTSGSAGQAGSINADMITFMSATVLDVAERNTILKQFGDVLPLPGNSSKTIRITRQEKFAVDATPNQLTEGIPPEAQGLVINYVEATAEQYGFLVRISDLAELVAAHNIVQRTMYILGLHAAEVYDQLIFNVLDDGTTIYLPNSRAAVTDLVASDLIGYNDLVRLEADLMDNGARPLDGGMYVYVIPPQVYGGLLKDPDWKASHQLRDPESIWRGEVGSLGGLAVVRSNAPGFAFQAQATSAKTNKWYFGFALGRQAYSITDLQGLQVYTIAPGGHEDPLYQNRKISYKFAFKALILNNDWMIVTKSSGLNSTNNP